MRKTFFIINPSAGKHLGERLIPTIEKMWDEISTPCSVYVTQNHEDIAAGVHRAVNERATELVVIGGDGTLLAVVNALRGTQIPIGVVPCGTGNDFARTNGVLLDPLAALSRIRDGNGRKWIDVGSSNGSCFLNVASVGIDAAIVERTEQVRRWLKGPLVYLVASLIEIIRYRPTRITMTVDGKRDERNVVLVAVSNGKCYGGGMRIAPMADSTDGLYDVILANQMNRRALICLFPKLYSGKHIGHPGVETFRCRDIRIECASPALVNRDGEIETAIILHATEIASKIELIGI